MPETSTRSPRRSRAGRLARAAGPRRHWLQLLLLFVALALFANGLIGERGLFETLRARREFATLTASIDALAAENARLREEARRLREDPRTIEDVARRELGLIREGEVLFIIKDVPPGRRAAGAPGTPTQPQTPQTTPAR